MCSLLYVTCVVRVVRTTRAHRSAFTRLASAHCREDSNVRSVEPSFERESDHIRRGFGLRKLYVIRLATIARRTYALRARDESIMSCGGHVPEAGELRRTRDLRE